MELYDKISFLRKNKGLSQQELADKLDVSRQTIYKWEQGLTSPDISKLPELASLFHITTDLLLDNKVTEEELLKKMVNHEIIENKTSHRSMIDYLLMIPFSLAIFLVIFMFYMLGGLSVGFLFIFDIFSLVAPFYGFMILFANLNSTGGILCCLAIIIGGISLIYPLWILANKWKRVFLQLHFKLIKKIKSFNWKRYF